MLLKETRDRTFFRINRLFYYESNWQLIIFQAAFVFLESELKII